MIGLCHSCLTSNVEIVGESLCADCWHKKFGKKKSVENEPEPTIVDLKKKLEKKW